MTDTQVEHKNVAPEEESLESLTLTVQEKPDSGPAHYNLGLALSRNGQLEESVAEFRKALKLKPGMLEARINIAAVLLQQ